jgi:hypothetical protein
LIGAFSSCGIASPASAQALSPAVAARVAKLRSEARELFKKSDPKAIERTRAAWELSNDYVDLCNLGKMQFDLGRERDGAANLLTCLKMIPPPQVDREMADFRRAVERYVKLARALLGAVEVEANVAGAEVLVDGEMAGKLPMEDPIFVDPGLRTVEVRAPGFTSDIKKVDARAGTPVRLKMQLAELKPEVVPALKPDWAPVAEAQAPPSPQTAATGSPSPLPIPSQGMSAAAPNEEPSPMTGRFVFGIALSAVGLGFGFGGLVAARLAHEDAEAAERELDWTGLRDPCSTVRYRELCKEQGRSVDQITPLTILGVGGFVAAGVGGALVLHELVRASSHAAKNGPRAALLVTPRGSALTVTGSF